MVSITIMEIEFDIEIKKCCICGEHATEKHMSIIGQIPFYVCDFHYKNTSVCLGWDSTIKMNRIGLIDINGNWL